MNKRLLRSLCDFEYSKQCLNESVGANVVNDRVFLRGIVQRADALNQNGRVYPRDILAREVRNYQRLVLENRSTGELDHPDSSIISLQNVSHILTEVSMEGNDVYATVKLLNTPYGKLLQELVADNVKLGISSRGVGSTTRRGDYTIVQDDYQIICWDIVAEPSTANAFVLPYKESYKPDGKVLSNEEMAALKESACPVTQTKISKIVNEILSAKR